MTDLDAPTVAFMDNLKPDFQTRVFVAALRDNLLTKPLQWIAVADIGVFARRAFENPSQHNHKAIGLAGDELTISQFSKVFEEKTGQPFSGTYGVISSLLRFMVTELRLMIDWFASDGYGANIAELRKAHPGLMDLGTWIEKKSAFPKA
jgi:hypothetical protein